MKPGTEGLASPDSNTWMGGSDDTHTHEKATYMAELHPDAAQNLPYDMPEALGNPVNITCFVDADHAGNKVTRRSHSGIIICQQRSNNMVLQEAKYS